MKINTPVILVLCCFLSACSTFKIYELEKVKETKVVKETNESNEKDNKNESKTETVITVEKVINESKGIPFYTHKDVVEQTTILTRSWIDAEITHGVLIDNKLDPDSKQTFNFKFNIRKFDFNGFQNKLEKVKKEVADTVNCYVSNCVQTKINGLKSSLIKNEKVISNKDFIKESAMDFVNDNNQSLSSRLLQQVVSNTYETKTIIDYSKPYYFNSKIYPFTKSNTQFTLSDKGTLTTASNDVDTTGLADVIPLNDFLIDKLGLGEETIIDNTPDSTETETLSAVNLNKMNLKLKQIRESKSLTNTPEVEHQLTFKTELKSLVYTVKKTHYELDCYNSDSKTKQFCKPLNLMTIGASVTRETNKKDEKPETKEDDKSYQFSGKFTPPKDK
jgi:hypothetical protein